MVCKSRDIKQSLTIWNKMARSTKKKPSKWESRISLTSSAFFEKWVSELNQSPNRLAAEDDRRVGTS